MTDAQQPPDETEPNPDSPSNPDAAARAGTGTGPTVSETFAEGMAAAARRAGFAPAADGEPVSGQALLAAMGGIRGLVEAVLPGLVFLVVYTFTRKTIPDQSLVLSLIAPVVIGVVFLILRCAVRQTVAPAIGGLFGAGFSAVLALFSGNAADAFLPGFWTNGIYGVVLLVSVLVGWPILGLAVGFLMNDGITWRDDPSKRRVLTVLTLCWAALFALRLIVQLPLYFSNNVEWLAAAKLIMGIPLYAPLLVLSWLVVRSVYPAPGSAGTTSAGASGA
jgi:putative flippase GtrA